MGILNQDYVIVEPFEPLHGIRKQSVLVDFDKKFLKKMRIEANRKKFEEWMYAVVLPAIKE